MLRIKVRSQNGQSIVPCRADSTIRSFLEKINERNLGKSKTDDIESPAVARQLDMLVTEDGFKLFEDDLVGDVLDNNSIVRAVIKSNFQNESSKEKTANETKISHTAERRRTSSLIKQPINYTKRKPFRILLVRHGESTANLDPSVYDQTPEHRVPLSKDGQSMARGAGRAIAKYFQEVFGEPQNAGNIRIWYSPYVRTWQTAQGIMDTTGQWVKDMKEHPMLAELDYGLFEGHGRSFAESLGYKRELAHYNRRAQHSGRFWARFPLGESPFDVCVRMQLFFGTLARDRFSTHKDGPIETVIVVTHGVALRSFVKMWSHKSQDWYENEWNPNNCAVRLITEGGGDEWYLFNGYQHFNADEEASDPYAVSKKHAKTLEKTIKTESPGSSVTSTPDVSPNATPRTSLIKKTQLQNMEVCDIVVSSSDEETSLTVPSRK